jgi:hypothetical protein
MLVRSLPDRRNRQDHTLLGSRTASCVEAVTLACIQRALEHPTAGLDGWKSGRPSFLGFLIEILIVARLTLNINANNGFEIMRISRPRKGIRHALQGATTAHGTQTLAFTDKKGI